MRYPCRLDLSPLPTVTVWVLPHRPSEGRADGRPVRYCPATEAWCYLDGPGCVLGPTAVCVVGEK